MINAIKHFGGLLVLAGLTFLISAILQLSYNGKMSRLKSDLGHCILKKDKIEKELIVLQILRDEDSSNEINE